MRSRRLPFLVLSFVLLFRPFGSAQQAGTLAPLVQNYVRVNAPKVILARVRVIDGTGRAPQQDQNIVIERGKITSVEAGSDVSPTNSVTVLDLRGYTVMPGIVGMHNHLFYIARPNFKADWSWEEPLLVPQMTFSAPRLYLAAGVTTMRTTGSVETYADLNLKRKIDEGKLPGPHIDVTGPYLEGANSFAIQMHELSGPDEARQMVNYWAEAAELGIDDLEHGFFVNTQLDPDKKPDVCSASEGDYTIEHMDPNGPEARDLIQTLVNHHVAVTSTLPVFETSLPGRPPLQQRVLDVMTAEAREAYLYFRNRPTVKEPPKVDPEALFKRDMQLERAFAAAGGLLVAGPDPTGNGATVPGFCDQRGIELLVEAGFSPLEAIKIATLNGATYMGKQDQIGSIAAGKNADLVVVKGDPATHIADVENVEIVFKDGIGYDSKKLIDSVKGRYGQY